MFEEGSKLKAIGKEVFNDCSDLAKIDFPDGLVEIGLCAFKESGLENVELPASLRRIG